MAATPKAPLAAPAPASPSALPSAPDPERWLRPGRFVDADAPAVVAFAERAAAGATTPVERAVRLFYAVRDGIRYDPYGASVNADEYRASAIVGRPASFCVPKAILLAASARAVGVPARLGFADVRNHLQSEKLRARMGTDLFVFHGYAELCLDGRWRKATPAFNAELCERFGVRPLEFDGRSDALFQEYDASGRHFMEYVRDRGTYDDLPFDEMIAVFREHYVEVAAVLETAGGDVAGDDDDPAFRP